MMPAKDIQQYGNNGDQRKPMTPEILALFLCHFFLRSETANRSSHFGLLNEILRSMTERFSLTHLSFAHVAGSSDSHAQS
jgi:hypothetical protein